MRQTRMARLPGAIVCGSVLLCGWSAGHGQAGGARTFDRHVHLEDAAATSANVSIGDVNRDGHQDIVLVKGRHWPLDDLVLLGLGNGSFQPAYPLGSQPDRSYSGVLVDMDGDGDLDVVVSNDTPDPKIMHLNDGRGRPSCSRTGTDAPRDRAMCASAWREAGSRRNAWASLRGRRRRSKPPTSIVTAFPTWPCRIATGGRASSISTTAKGLSQSAGRSGLRQPPSGPRNRPTWMGMASWTSW